MIVSYMIRATRPLKLMLAVPKLSFYGADVGRLGANRVRVQGLQNVHILRGTRVGNTHERDHWHEHSITSKAL
jgi:hypothetical protein